MDVSFTYPIKPYVVNQPWGVHDPKDYSQFGFTDHNGIDLALAPDKKIYAPIRRPELGEVRSTIIRLAISQ